MGNNKTKLLSSYYSKNDLVSNSPLYSLKDESFSSPPEYSLKDNSVNDQQNIINNLIDICMYDCKIDDTLENKRKFISENINIIDLIDKISDFTYLIEKLSTIDYNQLDNINKIIDEGYNINYSCKIIRRLCISKYVDENKLIEFLTKNNLIEIMINNKPIEKSTNNITFIEFCIIGNKYKLAKILYAQGLKPLYKQDKETILRVQSYIEQETYHNLDLKNSICLCDLNKNDKLELYNHFISSNECTV